MTTRAANQCHCEERSDEAIPTTMGIASLRSQ
jgi:hypothetical protein